jgi:hypothetical protein
MGKHTTLVTDYDAILEVSMLTRCQIACYQQLCLLPFARAKEVHSYMHVLCEHTTDLVATCLCIQKNCVLPYMLTPKELYA